MQSLSLFLSITFYIFLSVSFPFTFLLYFQKHTLSVSNFFFLSVSHYLSLTRKHTHKHTHTHPHTHTHTNTRTHSRSCKILPGFCTLHSVWYCVLSWNFTSTFCIFIHTQFKFFSTHSAPFLLLRVCLCYLHRAVWFEDQGRKNERKLSQLFCKFAFSNVLTSFLLVVPD